MKAIMLETKDTVKHADDPRPVFADVSGGMSNLSCLSKSLGKYEVWRYE
jgi:hypothetical protein